MIGGPVNATPEPDRREIIGFVALLIAGIIAGTLLLVYVASVGT